MVKPFLERADTDSEEEEESKEGKNIRKKKQKIQDVNFSKLSRTEPTR